MLHRQLDTIQWLRALAAIFVVIFHTSQGIEFRTGILTSHWTDFGACGVDIFFVISGFIMTVVTGRQVFEWRDFLAKRAIRLMPIYWLLTLLKAISLVVLPSLVLFSVLSWPNVVTSLLLVPYDTAGRGLVPLIVVAWTLELEVMFYAIFAACRHYAGRYWAIAVGLVFLALNAVYALDVQNGVVQFYARPIFYEFLFGIAIGKLALHGRFLSPRLAVAVLAIALPLLLLVPIGSESTRFLTWGLPAAAMVLATVSLEGARLWRWRPMIEIGDSSYSLYLTHTLAVPVIMLPLKLFHFAAFGSALYLIAMIPLQILIGYACYRVFERPMTRWLQQRHRARRAVALAAV